LTSSALTPVSKSVDLIREVSGNQFRRPAEVDRAEVNREECFAALGPVVPNAERRVAVLGWFTTLVTALQDIVAVLTDADPESKATVYHDFGVALRYTPDGRVAAEAHPRRVIGRVGGGTCTLTPRAFRPAEYASAARGQEVASVFWNDLLYLHTHPETRSRRRISRRCWRWHDGRHFVQPATAQVDLGLVVQSAGLARCPPAQVAMVTVPTVVAVRFGRLGSGRLFG
jgi:hypothetical protein